MQLSPNKIDTTLVSSFVARNTRFNSSLWASKYIMILCEIDGYLIMVDPMNNITEGEMMYKYQRLIDQLHTKVIFPKKHALDNKDSAKYKAVI